MPRLIFNADDFGFTVGHNRAVVAAHQHGVLSRASLMSHGAAFADAVQCARNLPTLGIGVHLQLCEGLPVTPAEDVRPLVDAAGQFPDGILPIALRWQFQKSALAAIACEWHAQILRVHEAGLTIGHLDSHKHVHLLPPLLTIAMRLARQFAIPEIRLPAPQLSWNNLRRRPAMMALWSLAQAAKPRLRRAGLRFADHFRGFECSGQLDASMLNRLLDDLPTAGCVEIMSHPAADCVELEQLKARHDWARQYRFTDELAALCDPNIVARVAAINR